MELMLLRLFQKQVLLQCQFVIVAATNVNAGLNNRNSEHVWYSLQNMLNAGANISKTLWGQGGRLTEERRPLRDSIGVPDNSPLRQVTMRNNFEHLDERMDRWWRKSKHHNHVDKIIGPKATTIVGADPRDIFRFFDPQTTELIFWGQEIQHPGDCNRSPTDTPEA